MASTVNIGSLSGCEFLGTQMIIDDAEILKGIAILMIAAGLFVATAQWFTDDD